MVPATIPNLWSGKPENNVLFWKTDGCPHPEDVPMTTIEFAVPSAGKPMPTPSKTIAFDLDPDSLNSLREALPAAEIDEVNGATAASLMQDWDPGTVDLLVLTANRETAETLELCRFLVRCGVLGRAAPIVTDSQEALPKSLGLHRHRPNAARRPHAPLLVLVPAERKNMVKELLKAGADCCLLLPANAKEMASMLVRAQVGNQPGRHTLDRERAQTEDRWRDEGGQG